MINRSLIIGATELTMVVGWSVVRQKRLRPQMGLGIMAIGAIRTRVRPNSKNIRPIARGRWRTQTIAGYRGSPQMDSTFRIIGAITERVHSCRMIA